MMEILVYYLLGIAAFVSLATWNAARCNDVTIEDFTRIVMYSLTWPAIFVVFSLVWTSGLVAGLYSVKRDMVVFKKRDKK